MTIKQLREALAKIDPNFDTCRVVIYLPGSRIDLDGFMRLEPFDDAFFFEDQGTKKAFLVEGNVRPGSVLAKEE